jgi:very-short-patch-repair endonuclease
MGVGVEAGITFLLPDGRRWREAPDEGDGSRQSRDGSAAPLPQPLTLTPAPLPSGRGVSRALPHRHDRPMTTGQRRFARKLRRQSTEPEDVLWALLRDRRLDGLKFRRQVPLLAYTVDFLCFDRKLIVELDGHQHGWQAEYDAARTEEIERHGFTVIRFANAEILNDRDAVIAAIRRAIA